MKISSQVNDQDGPLDFSNFENIPEFGKKRDLW